MCFLCSDKNSVIVSQKIFQHLIKYLKITITWTLVDPKIEI